MIRANRPKGMIIDIFRFQFQLLLVVLGGMMSPVVVFMLLKKVRSVLPFAGNAVPPGAIGLCVPAYLLFYPVLDREEHVFKGIRSAVGVQLSADFLYPPFL